MKDKSSRPLRGNPSKMSCRVIGLITSAVIVIFSAGGLSSLIWVLNSSKNVEAAASPPFVTTPVGRFVGVLTPSVTYGSTYVSYKSIPFAKPPIGELRFKRPQPLDDPEVDCLVNSEQYKQSCWSVTKKSTDPSYGEDCLYLNIYVPGTEEAGQTGRKLPVIVWIHGGGFVAGSAFPEPEKLVVRGGVIVVTINYRLGVFGFLSTGDDALPGNNGLWDQYVAIKWVKDYITFFGGDDQSVTLYGESAGAMSVALHALSPISSGVFNKAIVQSGGATSLISRDARQRALEFASMVGCSSVHSSADLAKCLRQVSVAVILQYSQPSAFSLSLAQQQSDFIWMPVIDGEFIPDEPLKLLHNISYLETIGAYKKDFLFSILNNEGAMISDNFLRPISLAQVTNISFVTDLTNFLLYSRYGRNFTNSRELKDAIYTFYTGSSVLSPTVEPQDILDLAGDVALVIPALEMALTISDCHQPTSEICNSSFKQNSSCSRTTARTYVFMFDYCSTSEPCKTTCMIHGADVAYVFPRKIFPDPDQQKMSDMLVDILTTFARYSNPETVVPGGWPAFDTVSRSYLRFDVSPSVRQYPFNYRTQFWLKQVPVLNPFRN
ncbi:unnamed protein product [Candidula unifasciata]|uniref:Carboxylic ester hydrolase n=1 Tax=Candidula unifasciata TaxID=100452 RepID=A0A8S3Z6A9_9EUPU|nr:unnamed protein product [Candidula unifasciata]